MKRMTSAQITAKFGRPGKGGKLDQKWYRANIVSQPLPYPMRLAWKTSEVVKNVPMHRLAADLLFRALTDLWNEARRRTKVDEKARLRAEIKREIGYDQPTALYDREAEKRLSALDSAYWDRATLDLIRENGLDLFGGSFNFRPIRSGSSLSMHAYGIAFDLNPRGNPLGRPGVMPGWVIACFERAGFYWGGNFSRRDAQHFEATALF